MSEGEMCPNCVTPWKCNGPHEPAGVAEPIVVNVTTQQWLDQLAHAWEKGWEECANFVQDADQDPAFRDRYRNPYRVERREQ